MAGLDVTHVSKRFGQVKALQDISLSINDGEFMVLLGPTAAGKTTTLRCVAGLEKLDDGSVKMGGEPVDTLTPAERDVAFVFQSYALYPRKTAYENMASPLEARSWDRAQIDHRVREIATKLQIIELLDRHPSAMSGGQQQRVALGRAMVRQPRMFLMDEPLTNLDFMLRVEMRAELKRLQKELNTTFFYVTNDQVEAMSMADRIAVLNDGVLQQVDVPEAIYDHPANLFVAQFVGNPRMNTLECRFDQAARQLVSRNDTWHLALNDDQIDNLRAVHDPDNLIFGIRAEDIELTSVERDGSIPGAIYVVEPLGDRTYVDIEMGAETVKIQAEPDFQGEAGDAFSMIFDLDRFHIFEQSTGKTIY